jgi:hypothetical protein
LTAVLKKIRGQSVPDLNLVSLSNQPSSKMKLPRNPAIRKLWIAAFLLLLSTSLKSQDAAPRPKVAVKLQMYSPLSLLVQPLYKVKSHIPFTPRFYTGELEYAWSGRGGLLLGLGIRRLRSDGEVLPAAYDHQTAFRITLAYRHYPLAGRHGAMGGLVLSPFVRYVHGERDSYDGMEFYGISTTDALSAGLQAGWQFRVKGHLLINLGIGPELTYQHKVVEDHYTDAVTGLDFAGHTIWRQREGFHLTRSIGLSPDVSVALGWLF